MNRPALTSQGRLFINIPGESNIFKLYNFVKLGPLDKTFGEVEPIYSFTSDGKRIQVAISRDNIVEANTTISSLLPINSKSSLEKLTGKTFNLQVHYGMCGNPNNFYDFESVLILTNAETLSYSLTDLLAINPTQRATIEESASIKVNNFYRVTPLNFKTLYDAAFGRTIHGITYVERLGCDDQNIDNIRWIGLLDNATFIYTLDDGKTWLTNPAHSSGHTGLHLESTILNTKYNLFWTEKTGSASYLYVTDAHSVLDGSTVTANSLYQTTAGAIRGLAATSKNLYAVGGQGSGYFIQVELENYAINRIDEGVTFPYSSMYCVDALDDNLVVFGGEFGYYGVYKNGVLTPYLLDAAAVSIIRDIKLLDNNNWIVATDDSVFRTSNAGNTWTKVYDAVGNNQIAFYDSLYGYLVANSGVHLTLDGGFTWKLIETTAGVNVATAKLAPYDHNTLWIANLTAIKYGVG